MTCPYRYKKGHMSQEEKEEKLADDIDGTDWEKIKGNTPYIKFPVSPITVVSIFSKIL